MDLIMLLKDEHESRERKIRRIDRELELLPEGSLSKKNIRGNEYWYHQQRVDGKVHSRYVNPEEYPSLKADIERRKQLISQRKQLLRETEQIKKAAGGKLLESVSYV